MIMLVSAYVSSLQQCPAFHEVELGLVSVLVRLAGRFSWCWRSLGPIGGCQHPLERGCVWLFPFLVLFNGSSSRWSMIWFPYG